MKPEEFDQLYSNEKSCREYLFQVRWPDGFCCPNCGNSKTWPSKGGLFECSGCGHKTSVIAGTIFQDTHLPLTTWFRAIWWITSQKYGASALGLQRVLGIKNYRTVWTMLHKLRRAMVHPNMDKLIGRVEVDEAYIGGLEEDKKRGRGTENKAIVAIAVEINERKIGRIRLMVVYDVSASSLVPFILTNIQTGSTVITDGWPSYAGITHKGYLHEIINSKDVAKDELLPHAHLVISLLKRWLLGTLQGGVSLEYLQYYLDEFTFRFNRRNSKERGLLFHRLLQQAVRTPPVPSKEIRPKF